MANIIRRKHKVSLRSGMEVWPDQEGTPLSKRNCPPGQHGSKGYRKLSSYGKQLRSQNMLKTYYYLSQRQLSNIYDAAYQSAGDTKDNLVSLLERKLIALVYHARLASTIYAAAQLISHGHVLVNGKKVTSRGYNLKVGEVVQIKDSSRGHAEVVRGASLEARRVPDYIEVDHKLCSAKLSRYPSSSEAPLSHINLDQVVEYYFR